MKEEEKQGFFKKGVSKEEHQKTLEELEKAKADRDHWKNEYYRAYADTQNLRKSLEEEQRTAIRYRSEGFLEKLLPALDAFKMALDANPTSPEAKNYQQGFTFIYKQLMASLEDEGVSTLEPKLGSPYDVSYMHAVDSEERSDVPPNTVIQVYSLGVKLLDRLVRPAMVKVSKLPAKQEPEKPAEAPKESAGEPHKA